MSIQCECYEPAVIFDNELAIRELAKWLAAYDHDGEDGPGGVTYEEKASWMWKKIKTAACIQGDKDE